MSETVCIAGKIVALSRRPLGDHETVTMVEVTFQAPVLLSKWDELEALQELPGVCSVMITPVKGEGADNG